jgi:hypothetical protein
MAKAHSKLHPEGTPSHLPAQDAASADDLGPLCNRIALLTFAAAFGAVVGLVALSSTFTAGGGPVALTLGALPLLAAAAVVLRVRTLRAELRARRERRERPRDVAPALPRDVPGDSRA